MTEGRPAAHAGQADRDGGAFTRRAADGDGATMFFDDLLHAGKPQADSGPFRGEKWFKHLVDEIGWDGDSVILDDDLDIQTFSRSVLRHLDMEMAARDRKSTRLNSSHIPLSRMPSSA